MFLQRGIPTPLLLGDILEFDLTKGSFQVRRGHDLLDMILLQNQPATDTFQWDILKDRDTALRIGVLMADSAGFETSIVPMGPKLKLELVPAQPPTP